MSDEKALSAEKAPEPGEGAGAPVAASVPSEPGEVAGVSVATFVPGEGVGAPVAASASPEAAEVAGAPVVASVPPETAEGAAVAGVAVTPAASVAPGASAAADPFDAVEGAVGLGVDIVSIARMKRILERTPRFRERVFSAEERAYCDSTALPEVHYATRFAAKEAVLKALGTGFSDGAWVRDIEVRRNAKGRPYVHLSGHAKTVASNLGVRELPLSLSYTHTDAVACAMAITEDSVRVQEERVNPMEELAKQFKEARALLDDLPATTPSAEDVTPNGA